MSFGKTVLLALSLFAYYAKAQKNLDPVVAAGRCLSDFLEDFELKIFQKNSSQSLTKIFSERHKILIDCLRFYSDADDLSLLLGLAKKKEEFAEEVFLKILWLTANTPGLDFMNPLVTEFFASIYKTNPQKISVWLGDSAQGLLTKVSGFQKVSAGSPPPEGFLLYEGGTQEAKSYGWSMNYKPRLRLNIWNKLFSGHLYKSYVDLAIYFSDRENNIYKTHNMYYKYLKHKDSYIITFDKINYYRFFVPRPLLYLNAHSYRLLLDRMTYFQLTTLSKKERVERRVMLFPSFIGAPGLEEFHQEISKKLTEDGFLFWKRPGMVFSYNFLDSLPKIAVSKLKKQKTIKAQTFSLVVKVVADKNWFQKYAVESFLVPKEKLGDQVLNQKDHLQQATPPNVYFSLDESTGKVIENHRDGDTMFFPKYEIPKQEYFLAVLLFRHRVAEGCDNRVFFCYSPVKIYENIHTVFWEWLFPGVVEEKGSRLKRGSDRFMGMLPLYHPMDAEIVLIGPLTVGGEVGVKWVFLKPKSVEHRFVYREDRNLNENLRYYLQYETLYEKFKEDSEDTKTKVSIFEPQQK